MDIDPGAVEIAKLRLWLSLVVDEDDIENIKPLPNLDYKIVCGNSLLGVEKNLFNNHLFSELEKIKLLHFNETNPTKKQEYKNKIDELISKITNGHKEFDFEVYFSEVFHHKGGFDVVIANPPYGAELLEEQKKYLKNATNILLNESETLSCTFWEKHTTQSRENGVVCFILPNELLFQIYMTKARKFYLKNSQILFAINLGEDVFEAIVPTCVICLMKVQQNDYIIPVADLREAALEDLPKLLITENFPKTTNRNILSAPNAIFPSMPRYQNWSIGLPQVMSHLKHSAMMWRTALAPVATKSISSLNKLPKKTILKRNISKSAFVADNLTAFIAQPTPTNMFFTLLTGSTPKIGKNIYSYLARNKELLIQKAWKRSKASELGTYYSGAVTKAYTESLKFFSVKQAMKLLLLLIGILVIIALILFILAW